MNAQESETNTIHIAKLNAIIKEWIADAHYFIETLRKEWEERAYTIFGTRNELCLTLKYKDALVRRMRGIDREIMQRKIMSLDNRKHLRYTDDENVAFLVQNHKTMKIFYNNEFRSGSMAWPQEHPELYSGGNAKAEYDRLVGSLS